MQRLRLLLIAAACGTDPADSGQTGPEVTTALRVAADRTDVHDFEAARVIRGEADGDWDELVWLVDGDVAAELVLAGSPEGITHEVRYAARSGGQLAAMSEAVAITAWTEDENPVSAAVWGVPSDPWDVKRLWMGTWGGAAATRWVVADGTDPDLAQHLDALREHTNGRMALLVDVSGWTARTGTVSTAVPDWCDRNDPTCPLCDVVSGSVLSGDGLDWCTHGATLNLALEDQVFRTWDLESVAAPLLGDPLLAGFVVSREPLNRQVAGLPADPVDVDAATVADAVAWLRENAPDALVVAGYRSEVVGQYDLFAYNHVADGECFGDWASACDTAEDGWTALPDLRGAYNADGVWGTALGPRRLGMFGEDLSLASFDGPVGTQTAIRVTTLAAEGSFGPVFDGTLPAADGAALIAVARPHTPTVAVRAWSDVAASWEDGWAQALEGR